MSQSGAVLVNFIFLFNRETFKPIHSVHPCLLLGEGGGLSLWPNFEKEGGLTGSKFLEGVCWERGVTFSVGEVYGFYIKNEIKSEISNDITKRQYIGGELPKKGSLDSFEI